MAGGHDVVMGGATIMHADLDAFFASVEQVLDPSLKGIPMAVGAGVVMAASYEARAFGVRSAMPTSTARRLCPKLTVVQGSYRRYPEFSQRVMDIFERYTPAIEQISIDEAFLDVTGSVHLFGEPVEIARRIRTEVQDEIGLVVSIGIATTKFLAKVGSQVTKPDGLVVVAPGEELDFLHPLSIDYLWGVGPATSAKLRNRGIETVGDLAGTPYSGLVKWLGPASGHHLNTLSHNLDPRVVRGRPRAKSVGSQQALGIGIRHPDEIDKVVLTLAHRITHRMRGKDRRGRTISVRVRYPGPRVVSRSLTIETPTASTETVRRIARRLIDSAQDGETEPITLIGISVSGLDDPGFAQLELPVSDDEWAVERDGTEAAAMDSSLDRHLDEIIRRFGNRAVTRAGLLGRTDHNAPDDFRRLAERD